MTKRPSARWTGIIEFPELNINIDGGLYSTVRRGRTPLPIVSIHQQCQTRLKPEAEVKEDKLEDQDEKVKTSSITPTTRVVFCPTCDRFLRTDEIGLAVETELGLLQIAKEELDSLKPKKQKTISAQLVQEATSALATIGKGRRFYLFPKALSIIDYYLLFEVLHRSERVGFIPEIVVDKRTYAVVIQPIITHPSIFGKAVKLIVVDEFADTDTLYDPLEFQLLPVQEPDILEENIAKRVTLAKKKKMALNPDQCVNPQRRKFKELIAHKLQIQKVL